MRLVTAAAVPAGPGRVVATIDGEERYWDVTVPAGLDPADRTIPLPDLGPRSYHGPATAGDAPAPAASA